MHLGHVAVGLAAKLIAPLACSTAEPFGGNIERSKT